MACFADNKDISAAELERNYTYFISNIEFMTAKREAMRRAEYKMLTSEQLNTFYVGYRQLSESELDKYEPGRWPFPIPYTNVDQVNVTVDIRGFQASCTSLRVGALQWDTFGCNVS